MYLVISASNSIYVKWENVYWIRILTEWIDISMTNRPMTDNIQIAIFTYISMRYLHSFLIACVSSEAFTIHCHTISTFSGVMLVHKYYTQGLGKSIKRF